MSAAAAAPIASVLDQKLVAFRERQSRRKERTPPAPDPKWDRSTTLALANPSCTVCHGAGVRIAFIWGRSSPCNCVLRAIFRICCGRFLHCVQQERHLSRVSLEPHMAGRSRPGTWGRKNEEFIADFWLVARRTLDVQEWRVLRLHFMLGADWKLCARRLGFNRGSFFHSVYRIEQKLGRVFRELEPYALFPLDEYFHGPSRYQAAGTANDPPNWRHALRPPLALQ